MSFKNKVKACLAILICITLFSTFFKLQETYAQSGTSLLMFQSENLNLSQGTTNFVMPVIIDTSTSVRAVDIIIIFDNSKLQLTSFNDNAAQNSSLRYAFPIDANGDLQTSVLINSANTSSKITFSYSTYDWNTNSLTAPFQGNITLATLGFNIISQTSSNLTFQYNVSTPTLDTNIVSNDQTPIDLIQNQTNLRALNITFAAPTYTPTPTSTFTPTTIPTQTPTLLPTQTPTILPTQTPTTIPTVYISPTITPTNINFKNKCDLDGDRAVTLSDLSILSSNWQTANSRADCNNDGFVNLSDLSILSSNWQKRF